MSNSKFVQSPTEGLTPLRLAHVWSKRGKHMRQCFDKGVVLEIP
ncbi:MAG: hypothetical protein WD627_11660 [Actinomycetota bacterium]